MKKLFVSLLLYTFAFGLVTATTASAKDEELLQAMVTLEKAYIPPLFFTNQRPTPDMPVEKIINVSKKSLKLFRQEWNYFSLEYVEYRPNEKNWGAYFTIIETAVSNAEEIVFSATPYNVNPKAPLVAAHEELEAVRATMNVMRNHNGFPKFITDKMTDFHDPMEEMVQPLIPLTSPDQIDEHLMVHIGLTLDDVISAWNKLAKCPMDYELWQFNSDQVTDFEDYMAAEYAYLNRFALAYEQGDKKTLLQTAKLVKKTFVQLYTLFGDFAAVMGN